VAHGVRAIAQVFRRRLPQTRVIMMGILPVSNKTKWARCQQVNAVNAALTCNKNELVYLDLQDKFLQSNGSINEQLFTDGTHLTPQG
jgi:lysophospholipase L1-like esterase